MLGTPPQAVADQMHDAGLQRRGRKNRPQRLRYSFEAIRDGDQNIFNATSLEVVEHLHPKLGTLGALDPYTQNVARAIR